jgi:hypothetical protein
VSVASDRLAGLLSEHGLAANVYAVHWPVYARSPEAVFELHLVAAHPTAPAPMPARIASYPNTLGIEVCLDRLEEHLDAGGSPYDFVPPNPRPVEWLLRGWRGSGAWRRWMPGQGQEPSIPPVAPLADEPWGGYHA